MPSIDTSRQTPPFEPAPNHDRVLNALAAMDRIRSARDAAECLEVLFQATQAIGATASLYAVTIPEKGRELSSITLFACDPGFADRLFDSGPVESHPWVRFARAHTSPATDRQIRIHSASDAAAVELARDHGFGSYLVVPTIAGPELGRVDLLCLGKDVEGGFEGEDQRTVRMLARALAAELHDWFTLQLQAGLRQAARLQAQDLQMLALEWEGLGTKEIAQRTGMTMTAVDSRFQRLNRRLNCSSRRASARRAAEHGLLEACRPGTTLGKPQS
jgi:DNA-binding CsgD family transcriptional regulator